MTSMRRYCNIPLLFSLLMSVSVSAYSQTAKSSMDRDSNIVFGTIPPTTNPSLDANAYKRAFGMNIMISTNGFGAGLFYRREFSDLIAGAIDLTVSEAKDDDEKEVSDFYGRPIVLGKVNRFLIFPLLASVEYRLFKDDILDNFRPYLTGAIGPTMIYFFPYDEEYFSALGKGQMRYTYGGYIGGGAYFGSERSNLLGLNLRYYFVPYPAGLEDIQGTSKTQFGGIYITLSFGSAW